MAIRADTIAFHRFIDKVPCQESSFVLEMDASTFQSEFPKQKKTQLHVFKITDPRSFKGLRSTISFESLALPFYDCVEQICTESNMEQEDITLRYYDANGEECKEKCRIQTFLQRLGTDHPIDVIDLFPPHHNSKRLFEPPKVIKMNRW